MIRKQSRHFLYNIDEKFNVSYYKQVLLQLYKKGGVEKVIRHRRGIGTPLRRREDYTNNIYPVWLSSSRRAMELAISLMAKAGLVPTDIQHTRGDDRPVKVYWTGQISQRDKGHTCRMIFESFIGIPDNGPRQTRLIQINTCSYGNEYPFRDIAHLFVESLKSRRWLAAS